MPKRGQVVATMPTSLLNIASLHEKHAIASVAICVDSICEDMHKDSMNMNTDMSKNKDMLPNIKKSTQMPNM